jgi:hypothetical protein
MVKSISGGGFFSLMARMALSTWALRTSSREAAGWPSSEVSIMDPLKERDAPEFTGGEGVEAHKDGNSSWQIMRTEILSRINSMARHEAKGDRRENVVVISRAEE